MRHATLLGILATFIWPVVASATEPVRVNDLEKNVRARLIAAKTEGRGWLIARFETEDDDRKEIRIVFPLHSFTTHEQSLMKIIEGSLDDRGAKDDPWHRVRPGVEVGFSLPPEGAGLEGGGTGSKSIDHCYLFSFTLKPAK